MSLVILVKIGQGQFTVAAMYSLSCSLILVSIYLSHKGKLGSSVLLSAWVCVTLPFLLAYFELLPAFQIIPQLVLIMGIFQVACVNRSSRYALLFYCVGMLMLVSFSQGATFYESLPFLIQVFALGIAVNFFVYFLEAQNNSLSTAIVNLQEINNREHALNLSLAKTNNELTMYSNIVCHDLKSPMHAISLCSELIREETTSSNEINKHSKTISKSVESMRDLIDDILLYSKVDPDTNKELESIDLNMKINTVMGNLEHEIDTHSVKLTVGKLPTIQGDKPMMNALFHNLMSNAIKFQPQNKPDHTPHIKISSKLNSKNQHTILFEDNGIGLPLNAGEENFEPFKRYHSANYEGTGLGMSICKRVMQFHKGNFTLKRTSDQGSCFELTFPSELYQLSEISDPDPNSDTERSTYTKPSTHNIEHPKSGKALTT